MQRRKNNQPEVSPNSTASNNMDKSSNNLNPTTQPRARRSGTYFLLLLVIVIVASYTSLTASTLEKNNPLTADPMGKRQESIDQPFIRTRTRAPDNNGNNNKSEDSSENGNGSADEAGDEDDDEEESGDDGGDDDEGDGDDGGGDGSDGDDDGGDEGDDEEGDDDKSQNEVVKEDKSKDKHNSVAEPPQPQTPTPIRIPRKEPAENKSKSADRNESVDRSSGEPIPLTVPEEECVSFDHGDTSPTQNVTSIFNCGNAHKNCEWYFPGKFFHPCGIGKEFIPKINEMKELYNSQTLWLNGPPIVIPWASIDPPKMRKNAQFVNTGWNRHNISMTHVHKTGGTSLVMAFSNVLGMGAKGTRHTVYMPGKLPRKPTNAKQFAQKAAMSRDRGAGRSPPQTRSNIYGPGFQKVSKFLDGAVKYRKRDEWGPTDHTLLAVVRDPADRFISAIGQATGAFGSSMNGVARDLVTECVDGKETSKESLRCFIDLVKTNSTWTEVHFTPMAMEISFATIYKDIPVAVFPFEMVPSLMLELGSNPSMKKKDGHQKGYRKSDILTNMSMDDYDDDMMKSLCEIYKMDAVFFHHLGMENSCDPHLDYPTTM